MNFEEHYRTKLASGMSVPRAAFTAVMETYGDASKALAAAVLKFDPSQARDESGKWTEGGGGGGESGSLTTQAGVSLQEFSQRRSAPEIARNYYNHPSLLVIKIKHVPRGEPGGVENAGPEGTMRVTSRSKFTGHTETEDWTKPSGHKEWEIVRTL